MACLKGEVWELDTREIITIVEQINKDWIKVITTNDKLSVIHSSHLRYWLNKPKEANYATKIK